MDAFLPKVVFLDEEDLRGVGSEANQALTSFDLDKSPLRPLTLREAKVSGFSIISESVLGGWWADQSRGPGGATGRGFLVAILRLSFDAAASDVVRP